MKNWNRFVILIIVGSLLVILKALSAADNFLTYFRQAKYEKPTVKGQEIITTNTDNELNELDYKLYDLDTEMKYVEDELSRSEKLQELIFDDDEIPDNRNSNQKEHQSFEHLNSSQKKSESPNQAPPDESPNTFNSYEEQHEIPDAQLNQNLTHIPKIIHQFWNDMILPTQFVDNVKGLVSHNSAQEWKYYFWTLKTARAIIRDEYPDLLYTWDHYPDILSRTDAIRYVVLHRYGGVYFDLDTVSVRPLNPFLSNHTCVFVNEPEEHYIIAYNQKLFLSTASMLCRPQHPFFMDVIQSLPSFLQKGCKNGYQCTGPSVLTELFLRYKYKYVNSTEIVSTEYFQDVYDRKLLSTSVNMKCNRMHSLTSLQKESCKTWIMRGRDARKLSLKAFTYHTWYHVGMSKSGKMNVSFKPENNIAQIVPHFKMYKQTLSYTTNSSTFQNV